MASNWISVQERLPEKEGKYLVCYDQSRISILNYVNDPESLCSDEPEYEGPGFYDSEDIAEYGEIYGWREFRVDCITHWMPLPDLPKGE